MKKFTFKTKLLTALFASAVVFSVNAHNEIDEHYMTPGPSEDACTSIMAGKAATTDGSTITSHTCDGNYRTWAEIVPAMTHEDGAEVEIYKGIMHTEYPNDRTKVKVAGTIPQVEKTYAYLNTAYPAMNEKMLTMGETTITGRRDLINRDALFQIEELQKLVLQRTTTAREAIMLIDELVQQYGYADAGECLTIADKDEVWHFEIFGVGKDKIGGVWAAVRIPDDHVGVSANIPRISRIDLKDKKNYMASENVYDVAKELGYWDGKSEFVWWKAYGGGKKAYAIRDFFVLSTLAPSLNLNMDGEELPFSVKPDKKVSVMDVINLQKSYYEGTEFDPTRNLKITVKDNETKEEKEIISPYANPWMKRDYSNMINAQKEGAVEWVRLISVPQCAYHTVLQVRGWMPEELGAVAWYGLDNPGQSPRIPVYSGTLSLPDYFAVDGQHRYRTDAAVWSYRRANKLATIKWGDTREDIEGGVKKFEQKALGEMPDLERRATELIKQGKNEEAKELITGYVHDFANATQKHWWELGDKFWLLFARGI